jgi:CheY-like chemotaxis protein
MQRGHSILLVEDSRPDALAIQVLLQSIGVQNPIVTVENGRQAMDYLAGVGAFSDREQYPFPGILLLDLRMPEVDGFDVLEWWHLQRGARDLLVIVLSARDDIRQMNYAYALGARSFLVKPCNASDVQNLINAFPEFWEITPQLPAQGTQDLGDNARYLQ